MSTDLVKHVFHSNAFSEIIHNAWQVIESNGEKMNEWFARESVTVVEDISNRTRIPK